jgi:SAM-dependent methyltransferase
MLKEAKKYNNRTKFIRADANSLPLIDGKFDFIFCVNAIHHFANQKKFITNTVKLLKTNGIFTIVGLDLWDEAYKWYICDYFDGILEKDLKRFPSFQEIQTWMEESGILGININTVEEIKSDRNAGNVFSDPFLQKDQSSQLAALSGQEYSTGIDKIKKAIENNHDIVFPVRLKFISISGRKT